MTTTSCIQICQKSQEGTLRNFLHNSHFATQNSHNLKVAFWHGIFSGPSCFRILFLGCARRTKWTYIHKYSFSFGVGSDFQFLSEVAKSRILVWMSWYHDILLIKPARAVEVFNGWVLPQLKKWFPPLRKEGKKSKTSSQNLQVWGVLLNLQTWAKVNLMTIMTLWSPNQSKARTKCWYHWGYSFLVKESFFESPCWISRVNLKTLYTTSSWSLSNWTEQSTQRSLRHCVVWMHFMACNTTKWAPTSHKYL